MESIWSILPKTFFESICFIGLVRRQFGWQQLILRFDYELQYRKGVCNIADPVSHNPALINMVIHNSAVGPVTMDKLREMHTEHLTDKLVHESRQDNFDFELRAERRKER